MILEEMPYYELYAEYNDHVSTYAEIKYFVESILDELANLSNNLIYWGHGGAKKKFKVSSLGDPQWDDLFQEYARFLSKNLSRKKLQPETASNNWHFNFYHSTKDGESWGNRNKPSVPYVVLDIYTENNYSVTGSYSQPGKKISVKLRVEKKYIKSFGGTKFLLDFFKNISSLQLPLDFSYVFDSAFQALSCIHSQPMNAREYINTRKVHPAWCWLYKTTRPEVITFFSDSLPVHHIEKNTSTLFFQLTQSVTDNANVKHKATAKAIQEIYFSMYFGDTIVRMCRVLPWDEDEPIPAQKFIVKCAIFDDYDADRNVYILKRMKKRKHVLSIASVKRAAIGYTMPTEKELTRRCTDTVEARFARHQIQTLDSLDSNSATLEWHIGCEVNYKNLLEVFEYAGIGKERLKILYKPKLMANQIRS